MTTPTGGFVLKSKTAVALGAIASVPAGLPAAPGALALLAARAGRQPSPSSV
jgi:hypothetical protein